MNSDKQLDAAMNAVVALTEAIRQLKQVPSGHLYAQVMGVMSIDQYEALITIILRTGLVERDQSSLLRWVGPATVRLV